MELRGRRRAKKPQSGFFRRQYDSTVRGKWEGAVRRHRRNPVEKPGGIPVGGIASARGRAAGGRRGSPAGGAKENRFPLRRSDASHPPTPGMRRETVLLKKAKSSPECGQSADQTNPRCRAVTDAPNAVGVWLAEAMPSAQRSPVGKTRIGPAAVPALPHCPEDRGGSLPLRHSGERSGAAIRIPPFPRSRPHPSPGTDPKGRAAASCRGGPGLPRHRRRRGVHHSLGTIAPGILTAAAPFRWPHPPLGRAQAFLSLAPFQGGGSRGRARGKASKAAPGDAKPATAPPLPAVLPGEHEGIFFSWKKNIPS